MCRAELKDGPPPTEMVVALLLLQLIKLLPFCIVQLIAQQDILGGGRGGDDFRATPHGEWLVVVVFVSQTLVGRALVVNVDGPVVVAPPDAACAPTGAILAGLLASTKYARLHVATAVGAVALLLPAATGDKHSDESSNQKEGQQGANHSSRNHAGIGWVRWGLCRREDRKGRERQEKVQKRQKKTAGKKKEKLMARKKKCGKEGRGEHRRMEGVG